MCLILSIETSTRSCSVALSLNGKLVNSIEEVSEQYSHSEQLTVFIEQLLLNENRTFKKKEDLIKIFDQNEIDKDKDIAFTCGSGVTACILGLANSIISGKKPTIYDGSWSEYGLE